MTIIDYIAIVATWLLINVFVKLLINSVERLYKNKIDNTVLKIPSFTKLTTIEIFRIVLLIFFAPTIILASIVHLKVKKDPINDIIYLRQFFLSLHGFRDRLPLFWFFLKHPILWINPSAHKDEISELISKLLKEGKYFPMKSKRTSK